MAPATPADLPEVPPEMDWEVFRREGHKMVDFIADYHQSLKERKFSPFPAVEPGFLRHSLPDKEAPTKPCGSFDEVLHQVGEHILPGMTHWQHPDFFAWFPSQISPAALLGDTLASSFNQPGFNWQASPAATELEMIVMGWMADLLGLPPTMRWEGTGGGVMQPSASEAAIVALLAAKNRALDRCCGAGEDRAAAAGKLVCYVSDQAHFCVEKACRVLSIEHVRKIQTHQDTTGNFPMLGTTVSEQMEKDVATGLIPCFLSMNYGTTGVCAVDDFAGLIPVCRKHHVWMNLDAAYAGVTAICPEFRAPLLPAFEAVDSLFINGSKWFSLMFNASFFFFTERKYIAQSLNASGVYLTNRYTEENAVVDFKDYQLGMGRPFRALKLYTTLKYMGVEGLQATIRRHTGLAKYLHQLLSEVKDIEVPIPAKFGLVCFRMANDNDNKRTEKLLHRLNNDGRYFLVHTSVEGRIVIRIALAYPGLTSGDMDDLASCIANMAKQVDS